MDKNQLRSLIRSFLVEDIGRGDLTSESLFDPSQTGSARLVARESCIAAGAGTVAAEVFKVQTSGLSVINADQDIDPASDL